MRMRAFSGRVAKEILRDPLNLAFGLGFPLVLLVLLTAIQRNIPVNLFELERLTPGITVFGLSFMTLFSATLVTRDRESAFLQRLYTTPLSAADYILGYALPMLPMAITQGLICYLAAFCLGMAPTVSVLTALLALIPAAVFYIALGVICGSVLNVKQVGGLCGALLTNLTGFMAGIWFDIKLVGGAFETVAELLPFLHGVELSRAALKGELSAAWGHLAVVMLYATVGVVLAAVLFLRQMKKQ